MPLKQIKNAWNAGQLSPYMDGRTDLSKYYNGASQVINALILPHGGFTKRPGTIYKATSPSRAKLTPFEFSVGDALTLEWNNVLLRFYKDQAQVFKTYGSQDLAVFDSATGNSSLIAHWKMDDNAATQVVVDATVAGSHDGATSASNTSAMTVADESGTANEALDMRDGTDYITVNNNAAFLFGDGTDDSPFSVFIEFYYVSTGGYQYLLAKDETVGGAEYYISIDNADKLNFLLYDQSASGLARIITVNTITDGWHSLIVTYDGRGGSNAASGMRMVLDWDAESVTKQTSAAYVAMEDLTLDLYIGTTKNGTSIWQESISQVAMFDKELSDLEIAGLQGSVSSTAYSIVSPYSTAQAFGIHYTQSADVQYIAHEDVHPKKLSRYGGSYWVIEDVPFINGPFLTENTTDTSLVGFARTAGTARDEYYFPEGATGTLTASGVGNSPFKTTMVNALWLVKHTRDVDNDTDTFAKDTNVVPTLTTYASGAIFIKGDATVSFEPIATTKMAQLWRKEGNGEWQTYRSFRAPTAFSWTEDADDVMYAMTRSDNSIDGTLTAKEVINYGVVKVTAFTSSKVVSCEVVTKVMSDNASDNAVTTSLWAEGAWSTYRGFPRTVGFHEDRLWWASSTNDPDKTWSSKSAGRYEDMGFTTGLDDEAVTAIVKDNEVSQIQWMMSRKVMAIGGANREYSMSAQNPDDPITPLDKPIDPQTGFSSGDIQPVMLNDSIFFLQRSGKKLGAMKFDSVTENFTVDDATLLAYGLLDSAPTNMAVSRSPDSLIWVVRTDGVLPTFTYEPKEEVSGWGRQIFGNSTAVETPTGEVQSVAVIHGTTEDEIWVNVKRTISAAPVYYTELFAPRSWGSDIEDAKFVDSLVTYDGALAWTVTAAHLKGQTVSVFADGEVFDDAVANASTGVVTLAKATVATQAQVVQVGLPYTMKVRSMRLAVPQTGNALQTDVKRVTSIRTRYIRSLLGSAGTEYDIKGTEDGTVTEFMTDIGALYSTESKDTPKTSRGVQGGFQEDAYIVIVSDDPVPFTCLSAVAEVEV